MACTEATATFNGCRVRIMRGGSGAPLVFLHGASGAAWLPFMETLSERFEVVVPEHPGFGVSEMPDWLDNIGDLAYFYLDVLEALGLDGVHLVGASLGGWLALELAVRNSSRLRSLALAAPSGIHVKGVPKGDIFMWSPEETASKLFHDQSFAERMLNAPLDEEQQKAQMRNRIAMAKLAWQPRLYNPDLHKWLHRVKVPTLLVWGDHDKVVPPAYGPAFAELIPGARLEVISGCGHLPQVERADEFVSRLTAFIHEVAR